MTGHMSAERMASRWAVELRGLTKRFGDVLANAGMNVRVERGTIHGIIGENGAGKSTAMRLLYGLERPDSGAILIDGTPRSWSSPADAIGAGLGMVHQHFMLAGPFTALDNILLGAESHRFGLLRRGTGRARLAAMAQQYGLPVDWNASVADLPVGIQQRIEILKLLFRDARILILDEPTAVLTPPESEALFANLERLRMEGKTILLVTHKLREVIAHTQRVTVLRAGQVVGERETKSTTAQELADLMVGRKVALSFGSPAPVPVGATAIDAHGLTLAGKAGGRLRLDGVSLRVRCGELVGLAGVEGNGQSELAEALLHPAEPASRDSGEVRFLGHRVTHWPARRIRALGVAFIPEDRLRQGLLADLPVAENFLLGLQRQNRFRYDPGWAGTNAASPPTGTLSRRAGESRSGGVRIPLLRRVLSVVQGRVGLLSPRAIRNATLQALEAYDIRPRDESLPAGKFSGGNQQKLIIAREFERKPRAVIAMQPTRGVDVGSLEFIHRRILAARDEGAGVLLISSDLDELFALCDRLIVMYAGRVTAEFTRDRFSEREVGLKMGGG